MENSKQLSGHLRNVRNRIGSRNYYGEASKALGVDASQQRSQQLRSVLRGTEQALRGVESSVAGRTQGSLMSNAQRARMVALERQPIAEQFREQQGALSDEDAMLQSLLQQAAQRAGLGFEADRTRLGSFQGQFDTTVGSETEAARRALQRWMTDQQLAFNREQLAQQAAIAAADRASRERIAELNRAAQREAASRYQPDFSSLLSAVGGGGGGSSAGSSPTRFADSSGRVLGYEDRTGSYLTDYGVRDLEKSWRNPAQQILGGIGDWTGWW